MKKKIFKLPLDPGITISKRKNTFFLNGYLGSTFLNPHMLDRFGNYFFKYKKQKYIKMIPIHWQDQQKPTNRNCRVYSGRTNTFKPYKPIPIKYKSIINKKPPRMATGSHFDTKQNGLSAGYALFLRIWGLGYKFSLYPSTQNPSYQILSITAGHSHKIKFLIPTSCRIFLYPRNRLLLFSTEKDIVQNIGEQIQRVRPPFLYKNRGIRGEHEPLRIREGKKNN